MTYKSIHFPATGAEADADALAAAAELAALHDARLTVVSAFTPPAVQLASIVPANFYLDPALIQELTDTDEQTRAAVVRLAEAAAQRNGLAMGHDVVVAEYRTSTWDSAPQWAPLTDLVVLGPAQAQSDAAADLMLHARAPVLIARPEFAAKPDVAAVAWDGSPCAGRAVRAALPMLLTAKRVVIVQQASDLAGASRTAADPVLLADYLGLHGVDCVIEPIVGDGDTGDAIVDAVHCCGADVVVCGAYGHSRLSETVLGGVTRTILRAAFPSALLAH